MEMTGEQIRQAKLDAYPARKIKRYALGEDSPAARRFKAKKLKLDIRTRTKAHVARGIHRRKQRGHP